MTSFEAIRLLSILVDDTVLDFTTPDEAVDALNEAQLAKIRLWYRESNDHALRPLYRAQVVAPNDDISAWDVMYPVGLTIRGDNGHHAHLTFQEHEMYYSLQEQTAPNAPLAGREVQMGKFTVSKSLSGDYATIDFPAPQGTFYYIQYPERFTFTTPTATDDVPLQVERAYHPEVVGWAAHILSDIDTMETKRESVATLTTLKTFRQAEGEPR